MSILCATNFSAEAIAATNVAAALAQRLGQELWLIFVMPSETAQAFGDQVFATADATLKGEAARVRALGANVTPALLIGKIHRELPRFASENKVSLVIAGDAAHGPGATSSGALARLGQRLDVPLLAVRDPERLLAWARGHRPLKVMVGVDQTQSTDVAVRWVEKLSAFGKLELVGGHVFFPAAEYHRLGLPLPRGWNDLDPELVGALHRELVSKLPAAIPHRLRLEPAIGRVSDHLARIAAEEQVDLLVLGTHHRKALGRLFSVSEQCLQSAAMSVAAIPASGNEPVQPTIAKVDRVLIATDFSATGDRAVSWGLGILGPGGTVDLVNVATGPLTAGAERKIVDDLMSRVPEEARARGITVHAHALVSPSVSQAIVAAAERFNSSVICLGSRKGAQLSKLLFGSTAQGVFEASSRPVMVVRPPEA